jgi:hypothetical protein
MTTNIVSRASASRCGPPYTHRERDAARRKKIRRAIEERRAAARAAKAEKIKE